MSTNNFINRREVLENLRREYLHTLETCETELQFRVVRYMYQHMIDAIDKIPPAWNFELIKALEDMGFDVYTRNPKNKMTIGTMKG